MGAALRRVMDLGVDALRDALRDASRDAPRDACSVADNAARFDETHDASRVNPA